MKRKLRICFVVAAIVGLGVSILMVYVAWQHNPQGEFHGEGYVNWLDIGLLGGSWFSVITITVGAILLAITYIGSRLVNSDSKKD